MVEVGRGHLSLRGIRSSLRAVARSSGYNVWNIALLPGQAAEAMVPAEVRPGRVPLTPGDVTAVEKVAPRSTGGPGRRSESGPACDEGRRPA